MILYDSKVARGGGGGVAKKLVPMSRYSVTISICTVNCGRLLQSQHFTLTRLIIFMVFSVSVRGILVLGKFIVWVPSIWSRRLWPSVCTVWIYFKVYSISWHNIGKYCSTTTFLWYTIALCIPYLLCTFVFTFVPSVLSKDRIIFVCKEKDYHILPSNLNLRLYGHLKIMSTLLFSQALRSDEGLTLETSAF